MDKGAHYYKCDFQVHTPRDRQWKGQRPVEFSDREAYAKAFVQACREREIGAVAITDHHDFCFLPLIRHAAANEINELGQLVDEEQQLIVYPGLELTLSQPCQALLIFDRDFPDEYLGEILSTLNIEETPDTEAFHNEPTAPEGIDKLDVVVGRLNEKAKFRGRFIVLPNVTDRGTKSLLRSGFQAHYRNMSCVGGYTDGALSKLGDGNRSIVDGKNSDYGNKRIAVIQTSDARSADFEMLGASPTWIKWAKPTAEALRQACLAQESRISVDLPLLPSIFIKRIKVSNCKFLGHQVIELNKQFNAFIGGRGTGKSTMLEYLRWALCDQTAAIAADDLGIVLQEKRQSLIEKTLKVVEGEVEVDFSVQGVSHTVRRKAVTDEILLRIGNGDFASTNEDEIRTLLPVQGYSQRQLSSVSVREDELRRFVFSPIAKELKGIKEQFSQLNFKIKQSYQRWNRKREFEKDINILSRQISSLEQQIKEQREKLRGVSDEDKIILENHEKIQIEESFIEGTIEYFQSISQNLSNVRATVSAKLGQEQVDQKLPHASLLNDVKSNADKLLRAVEAQILKVEGDIGRAVSDGELSGPIEKWKIAKEVHDKKYEEANERAKSQSAILEKIKVLEQSLKEKRDKRIAKQKEMAEFSNADVNYRNLRKEWSELHQERFKLLSRQCEELNTLSEGQLLASLEGGMVPEKTGELIFAAITGSNVREKSVTSMIEEVNEASDTPAVWETILDEFERLAHFEPEKEQQGLIPDTPTLEQYSIKRSIVQKIPQYLSADGWLSFSLEVLEDKLEFKYRTKDGEYIPFGEASAGQQATTLLLTLLRQEGPPLLIDQPEDDLDNRVIQEVVEEIWLAKTKRQLVFASHNANLVVNGDAELVVCFDYRETGDQSFSTVTAEGAIDVEEIRKNITSVMEGGHDAFELRRQKYGF